jgi:hypothetical protein
MVNDAKEIFCQVINALLEEGDLKIRLAHAAEWMSRLERDMRVTTGTEVWTELFGIVHDLEKFQTKLSSQEENWLNERLLSIYVELNRGVLVF